LLVHLRDHDAAGDTAAAITRADVEAIAWRDDDSGLASYLGARDTIGTISYAMVIAAIALPMWALLYIHVLRNHRQLAILAALGFRRRELFAICALQSVIVAVLGCALGAALGFALTRYFDANPLFEWQSIVVRPAVSATTFLVPAVIVVATSLLAALHPALRAARVQPAVALRRIE
jgi:lipoprotein-releasing system permease protein